MLDMGEWKVCSVSIGDNIPPSLEMLTWAIPMVGVGLHNEGLHVRLPRGVKAEQIDGEHQWGINLYQT
jgi:hypothetical protein